MKHTANMIYKPTQESNELMLFATNTETLYRQRIAPVIENLTKKMQKGIYDTEKAIDLWYYTATAASDLYNKWYGYKFTVQERYTVAVDLETYFKEDVEDKANA